MNEFPTHPDIRLTSIAWVETIFNYAVLKGMLYLQLLQLVLDQF